MRHTRSGVYGVSKLAGEFYAQAYLNDPLDHSQYFRRLWAGWIENGARQFCGDDAATRRLRTTVCVVEDFVASPTYAPELALRTAELVEKKLSGLFHIGGGTPISWFDYARLIFEVAGLTPELKPTTEREHRTPARRPKYSALSNAKMSDAASHQCRRCAKLSKTICASASRTPRQREQGAACKARMVR